MCIDFHNVLDLGTGGRFLSVDQRTNPHCVNSSWIAHLHAFTSVALPAAARPSTTGPRISNRAWSSYVKRCHRPRSKITAQECFQRTGEDGKVHRLSLLMPNRPRVFIDDNPAICKEARRTNALVVQAARGGGAGRRTPCSEGNDWLLQQGSAISRLRSPNAPLLAEFPPNSGLVGKW